MKVGIILGNQLLINHPVVRHGVDVVIMIEADNLLRKHRYHSHKLILILSAMREFSDQLALEGQKTDYVQYQKGGSFSKILCSKLISLGATELVYMQPADRGARLSLEKLADKLDIQAIELKTEQFLVSSDEFIDWRRQHPKAQMETFYRWQRKRLNILMERGKPVGGDWNFDSKNRKPLPKKGAPDIPPLPQFKSSQLVDEVKRLVDKEFDDHPGSADSFWLPYSREQSLLWLDDFMMRRFAHFGTYEDAMKQGEGVLFHSVLSPLINIGLLRPDEVVERALKAYADGLAPLNSVEGFVRQIIGWREFMHGMYWNHPEMINANYFEFSKQLEDWWYTDGWQDQDLPLPVMDALKKVHDTGYNHHIERLMVLGSWFLMNEYDPKSVFSWFSTMYVDAYEWVMVPNVQGMSQYADGGIVATKPYISGSNYLQKMGRFWAAKSEADASGITELYWSFLYRNREKLKGNFRMGLALKQAEDRHDKKA